ncbi:hypothetical protein RSAG8_11792, partial [Rhizoctonia solani AG-8 WAC10335]
MEESKLKRIWVEGKRNKKKLFSQNTKVQADGPTQWLLQGRVSSKSPYVSKQLAR